MKAGYLLVGQPFEIPAIKDLMRNLVCLRVSPSCVSIDGEIRDENTGEFRRIKPDKTERYIGLSTNVEPTDAPFVDVSLIDNRPVAEGFKPKNKKRGKQKIQLQFPDRPFIIPELAKELGCSPSKVSIEVKELLKANKIKVIKVVKNKGQRGRGSKEYQLI